MSRTPLKSEMASRVSRSSKIVFLREDFKDLSGYDQVGRALKQLVEDGRLMSIGYGLYAKSTKAPSGQSMLLDDPHMIEKAALKRLGVDPSDQGRFSRKINLPANQPVNPIPGDDTQRLSQRLGLQFPYDWSNTQMNEDLLIEKVIEKYRFEDVMRLAFYYGLARIKHASQMRFQDEIPSRLSSILKNIEVGFFENTGAVR